MERHILWIIIGSALAALAVAIGAFGAHGLKSRVSADDLIIFETGVRYQMYHSLALILLGLIGVNFQSNVVQLPAILFLVGIIIFSGTLYLIPLTGLRWLGAITPIGGTALILGWIMLIFNLIRS
ncbi:MAG: DUF423 domain-containing protein [Candidatus Neomarinimicrobiota bacterium]|jgi:uncharacterized membrane protein YgdD (TMEM256/DUF423 family)|nr:DUF423 domain-containing protein [Candidatus Neomarinimicrobiota bacterium]MEC7871483.1 DUF423 domain-containing protein [Candidatus Neomarinimicrobiota bacterium]MEC9475210.1 DUF423 domain-containing protein [Candidatus Neomarinimicrobiota bacterium]|tara:strand:- start:149 stop:523 length:375 start_codon:yes stop_codon:yes gene_type:complete